MCSKVQTPEVQISWMSTEYTMYMNDESVKSKEHPTVRWVEKKVLDLKLVHAFPFYF